MSDTATCPTCGATCRIVGRDRDSSPQLQALQDTDAQSKIEQLKTSLHQLRETLQTERLTASTKISNLETELSNLRGLIGSPVSGEQSSD